MSQTAKICQYLCKAKYPSKFWYLLISESLNTDTISFASHCVSQVNENKKRPESVAYNKELAKSAP